MKLLVIGAGMMGSAAAYDMARQADVSSVTLATPTCAALARWPPASTIFTAIRR